MLKKAKNNLYKLAKANFFAFAIYGSCSTRAHASLLNLNIMDTATQSTDLVQNVIWVILASILVFFMQAGFALLESGSVRSKNTVNVMMKNYLDWCIGSLIFYCVGYGILMGNNPTGFFGMSHFLPMNLSLEESAVMLFQMMFAVTAVTIASGAMAERVRFGSYVIAAFIICAVIYSFVSFHKAFS